ncbi:ATP-binding protein [Streptomyces sp. Y7]|uniref:ATP-binding protein n=1 Tax=Streptomyces sp. Y7 TaxID=3342392 RepID=UPI0037238B58
MSDRNGDTYNYNVSNNYFGPEPLLKSPRATPRRVADDQLKRLQREFARPDGMGEAFDVLTGEHTVILHGEPGSGRTSAARVLLCELPPDGGMYLELTPEAPETVADRWLSPDLVGGHDRMLLDLSATDERTWYAVHEELSDFRHEVLRRGAFLALVLPSPFEEGLSPQFAQFRRRIGRPDGWEAVNRHLWLAGVHGNVRGLAPPALRTYLDSGPPMRDLARLAERIGTAARGPGNFASWCEAALAAQTDRTRDVADAVGRLRKGRQRALFLTTAMLEGARAEAVHRATNLLVDEAGSAHDERPLLEHKRLSLRLETVGAEAGPDARVRFTEPGFAKAARRLFWTDLPDIREPLGHWLTKVLKVRELEEPDSAEAVARFTDLCLSTHELERLTGLVEQWTLDSAHRGTEVRAAAHLLRHGIEDEQWNSRFRSAIYDWSTGRLPKHLREVLVEVCTKVMSIHHPEPALVRLHHLARNEPHPGVVARQGLLALVNQEVRLQRRLLARLATTQSERHHRADADLFLDLTELPDSFLLTAPTREWLTVCWRMAFDLLDPGRWADRTVRWLATADHVDDKDLAEAILSILVDASDTNYPVLSRIYADARRSVSPELASRLLQSINTAQRARFTRGAPDLEVSAS